MTAAERVLTVTPHLNEWHTIPELARSLQQRKSLVRWAIQASARYRVIFARHRTAVSLEYRIFPEAVRVIVVENSKNAQ